MPSIPTTTMTTTMTCCRASYVLFELHMYVGAKLCGEAGHGSARMWWNIDWVIGVFADEIRDKGGCSSDTVDTIDTL